MESSNSLDSINVTLRFSDHDTFTTTMNLTDTIELLVRKGIIHRSKLGNEIQPEFIPKNLCSKFKVVFKGKLYKDLEHNILTIDGITNDSVVHCIFPNLTPDEVNSIKNNITVTQQEINDLISSGPFLDLLKNPTHFNFVKQYINNPNPVVVQNVPSSTISQSSVTVDLDALYEEQIVVLANMGFDNSESVKKLLQKYNGNVQSVLNELLG
jgi:hypothetical protein